MMNILERLNDFLSYPAFYFSLYKLNKIYMKGLILKDSKQAKELVRTFIQVPMASGTRQDELDFYKDINDAFVMLLNALEENEKLDKIKEIIDMTETTVDENNYDSKNTTEMARAYLDIVKIIRGEENGNK